MDPELQAYLIIGTVITVILTLIFHYPFDVAWLPAFIAAAIVTFIGVWIVVELD